MGYKGLTYLTRGCLASCTVTGRPRRVQVSDGDNERSYRVEEAGHSGHQTARSCLQGPRVDGAGPEGPPGRREAKGCWPEAGRPGRGPGGSCGRGQRQEVRGPVGRGGSPWGLVRGPGWTGMLRAFPCALNSTIRAQGLARRGRRGARGPPPGWVGPTGGSGPGMAARVQGRTPDLGQPARPPHLEGGPVSKEPPSGFGGKGQSGNPRAGSLGPPRARPERAWPTGSPASSSPSQAALPLHARPGLLLLEALWAGPWSGSLAECFIGSRGWARWVWLGLSRDPTSSPGFRSHSPLLSFPAASASGLTSWNPSILPPTPELQHPQLPCKDTELVTPRSQLDHRESGPSGDGYKNKTFALCFAAQAAEDSGLTQEENRKAAAMALSTPKTPAQFKCSEHETVPKEFSPSWWSLLSYHALKPFLAQE
ncbi:collagen alpha-1(I) chain-like [Dromiciops gliroides]|uniref:collagen alpha-1(I) chain-like n=1 Tax=Dromiciops gliroides TaxID=33562 RepID=UPI001CC70EEE|nr:collagen alpha-1(I) chain-like [Dromiciops gliroides]